MKKKIFFSLEEILSRKEEFLQAIIKEFSVNGSIQDIFDLSSNTPILEESPIKIKKARSLMQEIYSESVRYLYVEGVEYPFVSEIGILGDEDELYIDKKSIKTLDRILEAAFPYLGAIKAFYTGEKFEEDYGIPFYEALHNKPEDYIQHIEYNNGVFTLPCKPDFEFVDYGHTHVFDINNPPLKEVAHILIPSAEDLEDHQSVDHYKVDVIYFPLKFESLNPKQKFYDFDKIPTGTVVGSRTRLDKIKKEIKFNLLVS